MTEDQYGQEMAAIAKEERALALRRDGKLPEKVFKRTDEAPAVVRRRAKIAAWILQAGSCKRQDVAKAFPNFSTRAITADMDKLQREGVIVRVTGSRGAHRDNVWKAA